MRQAGNCHKTPKRQAGSLLRGCFGVTPSAKKLKILNFDQKQRHEQTAKPFEAQAERFGVHPMNPEMLKALGARIRICADIVGNGDELARRTGIPRRTLETYLAGTAEPKTFRLAAIGKAASVRLEWLATGEGPKLLDGEEPHAPACADSVWEAFDLVPLYKVMVSAGPGAVVEGERIDAQLAFRKDWLRRIGLQTRQLALVRADGDSMQPTINDGDALLIDTSKRHLTDGHIYVMRINDELRAKRLQRLVDGSVRVSSDNTIYADEVVDASDLDQLHILGRVIWKGGLI